MDGFFIGKRFVCRRTMGHCYFPLRRVRQRLVEPDPLAGKENYHAFILPLRGMKFEEKDITSSQRLR